MSTTFKIIIAGIVFVIGVEVFFLVTRHSNNTSLTAATSTNPFGYIPNQNPSQTTPTQSGTLPIATQNGGTLSVTDFTKTSPHTSDSNAPFYTLVGDPVHEDPSKEAFQITYYDKSSYFIIALLQEPIGATRIAAEQALVQKLGISTSDLCSLKIFIDTPKEVNDAYSGRNLGVSSCPGATALPN